MKSKLLLAVLVLFALAFQKLPLQDASTFEPDIRAKVMASAAKPEVKPGSLVDLVGYANASDGFHSVVEYLPDSTAVIDNAFVFAPAAGASGRLVATQRYLLDLEYAGLENDDDITHLLTSVAENFVGDVFRMKLPLTLTNLYCDKVTFPAGLNCFEILAGGDCTITQAVDTESSIMFEIPHPENVNIESGIDFVGQVIPENVVNSGHGLISVRGNDKVGVGGRLRCQANFTNTTASGFGVTGQENLNNAYDSIEIRGAFENSGIVVNHTVNRLIIDASTTDPDGYGFTIGQQGKSRGLQFGRVIEFVDIDLQAKYGNSHSFGFAMNGPAGTINIHAERLGYLRNGEVLTDGGFLRTIFKVDTLGEDADLFVDIIGAENHPEFSFMASQSSPGPTNNMNWSVDSNSGNLHLMLIDDEGNSECYGNNLVSSILPTVHTGLCSEINQVTVDRLVLKRNTATTHDIASVGTRLIQTTVLDECTFNHGTHARFYNCNFPANFEFIESGEQFIYNFDNCQFANGTQFNPDVPSDLRLGFSGTNTGLNMDNVPVASLPYLRLDAIGHPRLEGSNFDQTSLEFETINRPLGWKTEGRAAPVWYSGSAAQPPRTTFLRMLDVDEETCIGRLTFPQITSNSLQQLGSFQWDLGVSNGVIEAAITFSAEGAPKAGLLGRAEHDLNAIFAYLDRDGNTVNLQIGQPGLGPGHSAPVEIDNGKEHILALHLEGSEIGVYVDGEKELTLDSPINQTFTQWGVKHLYGVGNYGSGIDAHGPKYRYLEVRPVAGDSTVEKERREL